MRPSLPRNEASIAIRMPSLPKSLCSMDSNVHNGHKTSKDFNEARNGSVLILIFFNLLKTVLFSGSPREYETEILFFPAVWQR